MGIIGDVCTQKIVKCELENKKKHIFFKENCRLLNIMTLRTLINVSFYFLFYRGKENGHNLYERCLT